MSLFRWCLWCFLPLLALGESEDWKSRIPQWDAGVRGGIPEVKAVQQVSAEALRSGGAKALNACIASARAPGAILLPAGEYVLKQPVHLKDGTVLRGRGMGKTRLIFDIPPPEEEEGAVRPAYGAIRLAGSQDYGELPITSGHVRGSKRLELPAGHGLHGGDLIIVFSENDPELMYTEARWNVSWALQSLAQIVQVAHSETRFIEIDVPLRLNYKAELRPRIRRLNPIENAGVEDLTVVGPEGFNDTLIGIEVGLNCWVRGVESAYTGRGHIWVNFSRFVTVTGNECHRAHDYGGGGNGYGIVAGNVATDCLFTDNLLHHLRHAIMAKRGSNGNVFAYNYSTKPVRWPQSKSPLCDISVHGHYSYANLFEGNVVEFVELADYWGPTGPLTTLFRNRVRLAFQVQDHSHRTNVIGNQLQNGRIHIDPSCDDVLLTGNLEESGEPAGAMAGLPPSLYWEGPPPFWLDAIPWPSIGPGTDPNQEPVIPAQRRWFERRERVAAP